MRRKRKQGSSSTPISETIAAPPSSDTLYETGPPMQDAQTIESLIEPKDRSAQETSQPPRSGRKRRRRKKSSAASISETVSAADTHVEQADAAQRSGNPPLASPLEETSSPGKEEASAEPSSKPRKRRRKRRQGGAGKSTPQHAVDAAPKPKVVWPDPKPPGKITASTTSETGEAGPHAVKPRVIWPDPKPSDRTDTADNRLAYTPEFIAEPAPKPLPLQDEETGSDGMEEERADSSESVTVKGCLYCGETKPLSDFLRRTGKKSGSESRRGACRDCRKRRRAVRIEDDEIASDPLPLPLAAGPARSLDLEEDVPETVPKRRFRRPPPEPPEGALLEPTREAELRTTKQGTVRMRGRTDKGRRWQQETDLEMARCLVREHAAVVVNRFTIRRLYTNRSFRRYILERDRYTCHFCGEYGDTIDHLLPRAKGGHTTPLNCVCACMLCNQNKADRDLDEFMEDAEPLGDVPADYGFERRPVEQ